MSFDPGPAAAVLHRARLDRAMVGRLADTIAPGDAPGDEAEGVAVQHALAMLLGAQAPHGFKIGATGRRMQDYLGLSGPVGGFMVASGVLGNGARFRRADYIQPGFECELAVRLGRDLPPGQCSQEQATDAVADLMVGIELVDNRYGPMDSLHMPTLVADQMFHAAAVQGAPAPAGWRDWDLAAIQGKILVDGVARDTGTGGELLGHPMRSLAWLAGSALAAAFGGLKAGQVIMLGSVTPPVWLDAPATVRVEFSGLAAVELALI